MKTIATLVLCVLLAACGGTDPADDRRDVGPPGCATDPEMCR